MKGRDSLRERLARLPWARIGLALVVLWTGFWLVALTAFYEWFFIGKVVALLLAPSFLYAALLILFHRRTKK